MKTKRYLVGLVVVAAVGLVAALVGSRARAQDVAPPVATGQFGAMGAVRGEVVRLGVSNINLYPPDPCRATLEFVDAGGNVLMRPDGTPVVRQVVLDAGQSAFVQFHAGALLGKDETRLNFRAVVLVSPPDPNLPPDPCVPSLEIIDGATGQTRLAVPGAIRMYSANHNETLVQDR
jgi:hypothetical protein